MEAKQDSHNPLENVELIDGVQNLRNELEWYRDGKSRSDSGISFQISGVWDVICGKSHILNGKVKHENIEEMVLSLVNNREEWVEKHSEITEESLSRVISLLATLDDIPSSYRIYGEDRERSSKYDIRTRCWVGLYDVTEKTTVVVYKHSTPARGFTTNTVTGVVTPRRDIGEYLYEDVFYTDKYDYTQIE